MTVTFAQLADEIPRDRWGRPLIAPPDGGKPIPYTRVSTLAKTLDSKEALMRWMQRMTVIGVGKRPDLAQLAAVLDPSDTKKLDEIVDTAMTAAESDRAANVGTLLHSLTEQMDNGTLTTRPDQYQAELAAYEEAMRGIEVVRSELFVVNDELQVAGTLDRLVRMPDGQLLIGDIKTGQNDPRFPHAVTTQVATYANSHIYDPATQKRVGYLPDLGISTSTGLLIHLPAGKGVCTLYRLDLTVGWMLARTAVAVRNVYKSKPIEEWKA